MQTSWVLISQTGSCPARRPRATTESEARPEPPPPRCVSTQRFVLRECALSGLQNCERQPRLTPRFYPHRRYRNCDTPAPSSHEEYKDISKLLRYSCISTCRRFLDGPCPRAAGARPAWLEHRDSRSA